MNWPEAILSIFTVICISMLGLALIMKFSKDKK